MSKSYKKKRWDYEDDDSERKKESYSTRRRSKRIKNDLKSKNVDKFTIYEDEME